MILQDELRAEGTSGDNFVIRPATEADIPALIALAQQTSSAAQWDKSSYMKIVQPDAPVRIALVICPDQCHIAGFVIARVAVNDCELENIVVDAKFQRRKLGSQLMRTLIDAARPRRVTRMFLEVRASNAAARALYENWGFVVSGRRRDYYKDPAEDAVLYTLELG